MYAVVDIGSNTIRLKIYKVDKNELKGVIDKKFFSKLASYINPFGQMDEFGILELIRVVKDYKEILELLDIKKYYFFATASLRNASNALDIVKRVKDECGIDITILSGEEEAEYDFYGVRINLEKPSGMILDIGGGSSEIVIYNDGLISKKYSIPIGSLNAYNRYYKDDGNYNDIKEKSLKKEVISLIKELDLPGFDGKYLIGVGGSIRALGKINASNYVTIEDIDRYLDLSKKSPKKWNKFILNNIPERFFTIKTGLIILKTIMNYFDITDLNISNFGIREGILINMLGSEIHDNAK